jgi:hypothetical protein
MAVPSPPTNPTPADGATGLNATGPTLTWSATGATSCRVYLTPPNQLAGGGTARRMFSPNIERSGLGVVDAGGTWSFVIDSPLAYPLTMAWQVIAVNADGETASPIWTFTVVDRAPATPSGPSPIDAGVSSSLSPTMAWTSADRATHYDVYFGTTNPPLLFVSGFTATNVTIGPLVDGTTYYWQIVANNSFSTPGPVWSFVARAEDFVSVFTSTTTGSVNNFNVGALSNINVLRMNNATLATITGFTNNGAAPADGTMVWIESVGAGQVDIANQDANSTAANRVINGVTGTISLAAGVGRALLCYDATTARWRVLEHTQGAAITPASPQTFFSGSSGMTWTVDVADVVSFNYYVRGRKLAIAFEVLSTTMGGTLSSALSIQLPGGFTSASQLALPFQYVDNGGAQAVGWIEADPGSPFLTLRKFGAGNWTASTNNTQAYGSIEIDVQ